MSARQDEPQQGRGSAVVRPAPGSVQPLFPMSLVLSVSQQRIAEREAASAAMLEAAECEARAMIDAAEERVRAIEEEARQRGFEAGSREVRDLCLRTAQQLEQVQQRLRQQLITAAVDLARQLLRQELASRPEAFFPVVEDVVRRCGLSDRVVLIVHPDQAALLERAAPELSRNAGVPGTLIVRANPACEPWSVIAETEVGVYVGGIDAGLDAAARGAHEEHPT